MQLERRGLKNQGFNGIRTHDLHDTTAMHYRLSYETTHWFTAMIILHFHLQPQFKYELFHIFFITSTVSTRLSMFELSFKNTRQDQQNMASKHLDMRCACTPLPWHPQHSKIGYVLHRDALSYREPLNFQKVFASISLWICFRTPSISNEPFSFLMCHVIGITIYM